MSKISNVLTELGVSKVRLAKYLGVSRQMLYNYLALNVIVNVNASMDGIVVVVIDDVMEIRRILYSRRNEETLLD